MVSDSEERQGLLDTERQDIRRRGFKEWASVKFAGFKTTRTGIFLMHRWLPVQDLFSDALVTFCKSDLNIPICSNNGLFWDPRNPWWGWLSATFMVIPCLMLWVFAFPVVLTSHQLKTIPKPLRYLFWIIFGVPLVALIDILMLVRFPFFQPKSALLLNIAKLRLIMEALLESPTQVVLQLRIFLVKVTTEDKELREDFDWNACGLLIFSICTSALSFGLTVIDILDLAREQDMAIHEALVDILCVGLGRRAPLLHTLKIQEAVDFGDEGGLEDDHAKQITNTAVASASLERMRFGAGNALSDAFVADILTTFSKRRKRLRTLTWEDSCGGAHAVEAGVDCNFTGAEMGELASTVSSGAHKGGKSLMKAFPPSFTDADFSEFTQGLPTGLTYLALTFYDRSNLTDALLHELVEVLPADLIYLALSFPGNQSLTDAAIQGLARALPAGLAHLALDLPSNENFTDATVQGLARALPAGLSRLSLVFGGINKDGWPVGNANFTDAALRALAEPGALPTGLAHLALNFWKNENFSNAALEELAEALPAGLVHLDLNLHSSASFTDASLQRLAAAIRPQRLVHLALDFDNGFRFTDAAVEELAGALPGGLAHLDLNFYWSQSLTDAALRDLAEALPAGLARLALCLGRNENFTDAGLGALARALPAGLAHLGLNFCYHTKFTDASLMQLASAIPAGLVHLALDFRENGKFTDAALKELAKAIPAGLVHLALDFRDNGKFTDDAFMELAKALPAGLVHLALNFYNNAKFTDAAFRGLAKALPAGLGHVFLRFDTRCAVAESTKRELRSAVPAGVTEPDISWD